MTKRHVKCQGNRVLFPYFSREGVIGLIRKGRSVTFSYMLPCFWRGKKKWYLLNIKGFRFDWYPHWHRGIWNVHFLFLVWMFVWVCFLEIFENSSFLVSEQYWYRYFWKGVQLFLFLFLKYQQREISMSSYKFNMIFIIL